MANNYTDPATNVGCGPYVLVMCSSRLLRSTSGRPVVCIVSGPGAADAPRGRAYLVLGDHLPTYTTHRASWLGQPTGRPPTARERLAKTPYHAPAPMLAHVRDDLEEIDDSEAIEACRREQMREPVDLITGSGIAT